MAIVAAGITVPEALKAHEQLRAAGIAARVIDLYSVKPVDRATLREAARECPDGLVVVEDHRPEGGLADAVAEAFEGTAAPAIRRLAVAVMSGSATPDEQLAAAGIDAGAIAAAARGRRPGWIGNALIWAAAAKPASTSAGRPSCFAAQRRWLRAGRVGANL